MNNPQPKQILVLTSSRADFGIYLPLLKKLKLDPLFDLKILAFGSHLSKYHGYTIEQIKDAGFNVDYEISTFLTDDKPVDISTSFGLTSLKFSDFWNNNQNFDWVIVLGDRYEMAAATLSGVPFGVKFAHISGGETTLGAFDNLYRHTIALASKLHFVSLNEFKKRIDQLLLYTEYESHIVGALSLDNLAEITLLTIDEFYTKWRIDLSKDSILITIHPETISFEKNKEFSNEVFNALTTIGSSKQLIVTMPNADTSGSLYREMFLNLKSSLPQNIHLIENFGTQSYFTCMKYCRLLIGNTSSGITEAASFQKHVLNLGDRQKGRPTGGNVISIPFNSQLIIDNSNKYLDKIFEGNNIYFNGSTANNIVQVLKNNKFD